MIQIEKLKLYIVKFVKNSAINTKKYFIDYVIRGNEYQSIVVITYDKYIFSMNDKVWRVWT